MRASRLGGSNHERFKKAGYPRGTRPSCVYKEGVKGLFRAKRRRYRQKYPVEVQAKKKTLNLEREMRQAQLGFRRQNSRQRETRARKTANPTKVKLAVWERQLAAGRGDKITVRCKREGKGKRKS